LNVNLYYCWFVLREWISQRNIAPKSKLVIWHAIRILFWTKHINNGIFKEDVTRRQQWRQYNIILITYRNQGYHICIIYAMIKRKIYKSGINTKLQLIKPNYWFPLVDWLIDWCLTPTLAAFQLYCGVNNFGKWHFHKKL